MLNHLLPSRLFLRAKKFEVYNYYNYLPVIYNNLMGEQEKLLEEDLEITETTAGAAPVQLPDKVISIFPAFAHRNFQLYFAGQVISLIGLWLHIIGLGYYTFQLTSSAFWVGMSLASFGLPIFLFSTFAGVFIERVNKQKLLIIGQSIEVLLAISLGIAVLTGLATLPVILLISFLMGTVGSVDIPARLSFIVEMVGKRDLASAIPINNAVFNIARFIGPAIAGVLIASIGVGWTFIINGITTIPAIAVLFFIKPVFHSISNKNTHPLKSLKEGLIYSFTHPKIFYLMLLATLTALFIWPYQTLMPVIAERVFSSGAQGLGSLLSAAGAGSITGAILTSSQARRKNKSQLVVFGLLLSTIALIAFSFNSSFLLAHVLLFLAGLGMITYITTINTLVQLASPDTMRARIMGVYLTMFVGMMPFGNALAGIIAEKTSTLFTVGLGAAAVLTISAVLFFKGILSRLQ